jgi:hypothetical protein
LRIRATTAPTDRPPPARPDDGREASLLLLPPSPLLSSRRRPFISLRRRPAQEHPLQPCRFIAVRPTRTLEPVAKRRFPLPASPATSPSHTPLVVVSRPTDLGSLIQSPHLPASKADLARWPPRRPAPSGRSRSSSAGRATRSAPTAARLRCVDPLPLPAALRCSTMGDDLELTTGSASTDISSSPAALVLVESGHLSLRCLRFRPPQDGLARLPRQEPHARVRAVSFNNETASGSLLTRALSLI